MTREEFVNVFVKRRKIAQSLILTLIALVVGTLVFSGVSIFAYKKVVNLEYFIVGWFAAEAITILYYYIFVYGKEKLKLNEDMIRDIIE